MPRTANSDNQQKILDFIKAQIDKKGYPPSVREICDAVGLKSTSTVHGHLVRLEKKGVLRRDSTKPRAMEVMDSRRNRLRTVSVPLIGKVTAGQPILAVENREDTMPLPIDFVGDGEHFILRVRGESMIEAGIYDDDLVVVRRQQDANNGDIVVALIGEEATVKRFFKEKGHIRLQPENSTMEPIIVEDCSILGLVTGLLQSLRVPRPHDRRLLYRKNNLAAVLRR